ncbi:MAG: hypothetical protein KKC18_03825, partial [Chloroflexi bacterium]|nr:hypothetical protein [Chloroflexota bacterium]
MVETQSQATLWPPPEGFVPIPSLLDGIKVYGPAPTETPEEETRTFKCPYCGGVTSYSASERLLTCPHCGRAQKVDTERVGQRATEFEFTLETMERAQYGWGTERRELACESCGAAVTVAPEILTSTCAWHCAWSTAKGISAVGRRSLPGALRARTWLEPQKAQVLVNISG